MAVSAADLLLDKDLGLVRLTDGDDAAVSWAHSSDLRDPTPFLAAGQLLLTTATQFDAAAPAADFEAYVARLVAVGVPALGIGTGVAWPAPPADLVQACRGQSLTLFEVPYAVPFIAVVRWVANALAAQATARDAWSVAAQRTVSLAALSPGRLTAVLEELARQLGGRVLLYDAHAGPAGGHGRAPAGLDEAAVRTEARRLLRRNARAGSQLGTPSCTVALQTLGRRDQLRGVLAIATTAAPDAAANAVTTGAVALVELALEDTGRFRAQQAAINTRLLALLLEGERPTVERILRGTGQRLPEAPLRVLISRPEAAADLEHALLERARVERADVLMAPQEHGHVAVVSDSWWHAAAGCYADQGVAVGASAVCEYAMLPGAIAAATAALHRTTRDRRVVTADDDPLFGLLPRGQIAELARSRLRPILDDPDATELLRAGAVWLRHNALFEPAARELGIHRHTLKAQTQRIERLLDLDLDAFAGRAELWALLQAH